MNGHSILAATTLRRATGSHFMRSSKPPSTEAPMAIEGQDLPSRCPRKAKEGEETAGAQMTPMPVVTPADEPSLRLTLTFVT
jgi:hypothetical protein